MLDLLKRYLHGQESAMLFVLEELVNRESPSTDKLLLDEFALLLRNRFQAIGGNVEILTVPKQGNHVQVSFPSSFNSNRPALILTHYDTVWEKGTLAHCPYRVEGNRAYGPGICDMKASIVMVEFAIQAITALGLELSRPVVLMITSDEELQSPSSREIIEHQSQQAEYVLVMEPSLPGGELKTSRKGCAHFTLTITGHSAHAGINPEEGVSAILELVHQIERLDKLNNAQTGTTVNIGRIEGGTRYNVVADYASAEIDIRVWTLEEAKKIEDIVREMSPVHSAAKLIVAGGFKSPPMERTPKIVNLFERAYNVGLELGLTLREAAVGGGGDASFTSALGIPTLDGLGAIGDGAHTHHEHIKIASLSERASLLAALLLRL